MSNIFCSTCEELLLAGEQLDPNCLTCLAIFDPLQKKSQDKEMPTETERKEAIQLALFSPDGED